MTIIRWGAWMLFAVGLIVGTLNDRRIVSLPRQVEGGWILRADLHVHSFFGDGGLAPWDLRREAERRGLDAIVITNHNQIATSLFGTWLASRGPGPLLVTGEEITAPRYHLIAVGTSRTVDWRPPLADVIDAVHAQGGVAIAAHPAAPRIETYEDKAVLQRLDGIEGPPPMIRRENPRTARTSALYSEALSANPNVGIVGASDYHLIAPVGAYRTFLLVHERSAAGIVEAIRAGRTAACSPRGRTYGNEALVLAVREDCVATASGAHAPNRWSRAAFGCTWLALLTLAVVTGPVRERPA